MLPLIFLIGLTALLVFLLFLSVKRLGDGEYGVVFRTGRPQWGKPGPGFVFMTPFVESLARVDVRPRTVELEVREWTPDGVRVAVEVTVGYRVSDPERSVVAVGDYAQATEWVLQSALGSAIASTNAPELAANVESLSADLERTTTELTRPWGVEIMGLRVEAVRV